MSATKTEKETKREREKKEEENAKGEKKTKYMLNSNIYLQKIAQEPRKKKTQ